MQSKCPPTIFQVSGGKTIGFTYIKAYSSVEQNIELCFVCPCCAIAFTAIQINGNIIVNRCRTCGYSMQPLGFLAKTKIMCHPDVELVKTMLPLVPFYVPTATYASAIKKNYASQNWAVLSEKAQYSFSDNGFGSRSNTLVLAKDRVLHKFQTTVSGPAKMIVLNTDGITAANIKKGSRLNQFFDNSTKASNNFEADDLNAAHYWHGAFNDRTEHIATEENKLR